MSQEFMHSDFFNKLLLVLHLVFLVAFLIFKWTDGPLNLLQDVRILPLQNLVNDLSTRRELNQYKSLLILFTSNFIGMMFSRGTHQQFYSWYSYSFPFLADAAFGDWHLSKFTVILALEIAWSVAKPRCPAQSYLLNVAHLLIISGLWF
jgi:alpha-1,3-mannosyltransferase